jgi:CheY-like chemotaxis protein
MIAAVDPAESSSAPASADDVLMIDDNEVVRRGLAHVLEKAGYAVTTAPHGLAALLALARRPYRAIVCDIMMPVMDGVDFYRETVKLHPEAAARVLFVTAWADEPTIGPILAQTGRPVLQKPFEMDEFLDAVRQIADVA